jgi:CRISPR type III-A/MTUBE-associated protein Csm6
MSYILFSPVGSTDPVFGGSDGSMLHIVRHYRPKVVVLYYTAEMQKNAELDDRYKRAVISLVPNCLVEERFSGIEQAHDFDAYHAPFEQEMVSLRRRYPEAELLFNVSSGTPQMKQELALLAVVHEIKAVQVSSPNEGSNKRTLRPESIDWEAEFKRTNDYEQTAKNRCSEPELMVYRESLLRAQIQSLCRKYDYIGAYSLAEDNAALIPADILRLLEHAYHRTLPDPQEAEKVAASLPKHLALYPAADTEAGKYLEYYLLTKLRMRQEEIDSFAVRAMVLADKLLSAYLLRDERIAEIVCEKKTAEYVLLKEKTPPELIEKLNKRFKGYDFTRSVAYEVWAKLASHYKLEEPANTLKDICNENEVRNISAHRLDPITRQDLHTPPETLAAKLEEALRVVFPTIPSDGAFDVFERINKTIAAWEI